MAKRPIDLGEDEFDFLDAVERLQRLALSACEGKDTANDQIYRNLRAALLSHRNLKSLIPDIIHSGDSLPRLCKNLAREGKRSARRTHVQKVFEPLIAYASSSGHRAPSATKAALSAEWTGQRSIVHQALIVRALAPAALGAVDRLLDEQTRVLGNGGPEDAEQRQAIDRLKELHAELGELIRLAEDNLPLGAQMRRLIAVKDRTLVALTKNLKLDVTALPISASALGVALAVIGTVELFTGSHTASVALGTMTGALHGKARADDRNREASK